MTGEPPCPPADGDTASPAAGTRPLRAVRRAFDAVDPAAWDALAGANPWATPFSRWAFHRAWWDGVRRPAPTRRRVVLVPAGAPDDAAPVAIVPLMHRHEVEPRDVELHTTMRHADGAQLTPVPPDAKAVFFGASYHADYATLLAAPADLPAVADALAAYCGHGWGPGPPRPVGRRGPPPPALRGPGRRRAGRGLRRARDGAGLDAQRGARGRLPGGGAARWAARSTTTSPPWARRSATRSGARSAGPRPTARSAWTTPPDPLADLPAFIDLHQKRWGADGLFPDTEGGRHSRVFFRRLFELFGVGRPAEAGVPDRRRAADRRRACRSRRRTRCSTTTPAWTPTRASCRRAW